MWICIAFGFSIWCGDPQDVPIALASPYHVRNWLALEEAAKDLIDKHKDHENE